MNVAVGVSGTHVIGMTNTSPLNVDRPGHLDDPRAFEGVLTRRVMASIIDLGAILALVLLVSTILTVATLGLFLVIVWLLPVTAIFAILYFAKTTSGPAQATWGMRLMGIRLETKDGAPVDFMLAAIHALVFWGSIAFATPFILLVGLFTNDRRLVHDILLGTLVVRSDTRLR